MAARASGCSWWRAAHARRPVPPLEQRTLLRSGVCRHHASGRDAAAATESEPGRRALHTRGKVADEVVEREYAAQYGGLDRATEADGRKVLLAEFLDRLERFVASEAGAALSQPPAGGGGPDTPAASVRLAAGEVTPAAAEALLRALAAGGRLHPADLVALLRAAADALAAEPTVRHLPWPAPGAEVVVVGDLHGQLGDLVAVLGLAGLPAAGRRTYVFNGDFVDRGAHSTEVLASLLALYLAHGSAVLLNRGNHEDTRLARVYGFEAELVAKYGAGTAAGIWSELGSLFAALPLAVVIGDPAPARQPGGGGRPAGGGGGKVPGAANRLSSTGAAVAGQLRVAPSVLPSAPVGGASDGGAVLVVHAGLGSDYGTTLADIAGLDRADPALGLASVCGKAADWAGADAARPARALVADLLWSDPNPDSRATGTEFNAARQGGCLFSREHARGWLRREGFTTLVRSHQLVLEGSCTLDCGGGTAVTTVFSASDYPGRAGWNKAAALVYADGPRPPRVLRYRGRPAKAAAAAGQTNVGAPVAEATLGAVCALFAAIDTNGDGVISRAEFAAAVCAELQPAGAPAALAIPGLTRGGAGIAVGGKVIKC
jgi:hypothetical protein